MEIDELWVASAVDAASADQITLGRAAVEHSVERMAALMDAWAIGFATRRADVVSAAFRAGARGWHPDECGTFLQGLDDGSLHVDSAGFVQPLCADPKRGQTRYALCCKSADAVTVNLEYVIQLGVVAQLHAAYGWPADRLRVELGEFDGAALGSDGRTALLMEAKCRVGGRDSLAVLLAKWLEFSRSGTTPASGNAANKYRYLQERTPDGPVTVLLVAAGARWWLRAHDRGGRVVFEEATPLYPA